MSSLFMADLAAEGDDKRRFQDYKKEKGNRGKASTYKMTKHNVQRVIAISEVFESL